MKKKKIKAVDETVLSICEWIQVELKESGSSRLNDVAGYGKCTG